MIITGTSYFVSMAKAIRYYALYEDDAEAVTKRKLEAGEIHIGKPPMKKGDKLTIIDNGARYAIESKD